MTASRDSKTPRTTRPYLEETTTVRVRFQAVDSLRSVWHGHYVSYFEEGRRVHCVIPDHGY